MGPSKATHLDVWAWQQNTGNRLEPWEVEMIDLLGGLWAKAQIEHRPNPTTPKPDGKR